MKTDLSPESIQHIARGFSRSRVLLTAVELDIFTLLDETPLSVDEVVARLVSDLRATTIFLDALSAMALLVKEADRYRTNPEVTRLLTADSKESILPGLMHTAHLWKTWSRITDVVQDGGRQRKMRRTTLIISKLSSAPCMSEPFALLLRS